MRYLGIFCLILFASLATSSRPGQSKQTPKQQPQQQSNGGIKIYAASDDGVSISKDNGKTWTIKTTGNGLARNRTTWIFGYKNKLYAGHEPKGLSVSADGGDTWKTKSYNVEGFVQKIGASKNKIYLLTENHVNSYADVLVSENEGDNWKQAKLPKGLIPGVVMGNQIHFTSDKIYCLPESQKVAISQDGGEKWVFKNITAGQRISYLWPIGNKIYIHDGNDNKPLYVSPDNGQSWIDTKLIPQGYVTSVVESGKGDVYVASFEKGVYVSNDNGKTWKLKTKSNGLGSVQIENLIVSGNNKVFATSRFDGGGLSMSDDKGETWKDIIKDTNVYAAFVM